MYRYIMHKCLHPTVKRFGRTMSQYNRKQKKINLTSVEFTDKVFEFRESARSSFQENITAYIMLYVVRSS